MKKRTRQIQTKLRSRKGMSLIELIVGISIIVIVFTGTLSAMTNGYADTLYNADVNRYAVQGGSLNEVILEAIAKQKFKGADCPVDVKDSEQRREYAVSYFLLDSDGRSKDPNSDPTNAVHSAAKAVMPDVMYVTQDQFWGSGKVVINNTVVDNMYTLDFDAVRTIFKGAKRYDIKGVEVLTSVTTSRGTVINRAFVPYEDQDKSET